MVKMLFRWSVLLLLLGSATASAQDVDSFGFSGAMYDRRGTLQLAWPTVGTPGSFYAGAGLVYAHRPLVADYGDGNVETIVASQTALRLGGGYDLGQHLRLDLELPLYPAVRAADLATLGSGDPSFDSSFAMGDVRLGATAPLLDDAVALALSPYVSLPTGSKDAYVSYGGVGGGLVGSMGAMAGQLGWVANLGVGLSRSTELDDTLKLGSNLNAGLGLHYDISDALLAGGELTAVLPFVGGFDPWNKRDVEAHVYGTWLGEGGLVGTLSAGTGVLAGVGAPDFRVALALAYSLAKVPDRDHDGIADPDDACPDDPEDMDGFEDSDGCPDRDNDKDGIADTADKCPNDPEDMDGFEDKNGCPDPDNDKDTVLDVVDACPIDPGPVETHGCPDRDHDLVPDIRDKCPDEPIDARADPEHSDGCPTRAVLTRTQIVILDKVYFDFDKAIIKPESYPVLEAVAKVLADNPQLKRVEVGGHTDDKGDDAYNLKLSQARVESVVAWLVHTGHVDPSRLVAVGYGETKPLVPNTDEESRANNRRVEFNILEQE